MNKIIVTKQEIAEVEPTRDSPLESQPTMKSPVPLWIKFLLSPLVLFLPVLCVLAAIFRIAMRNQPPRTRDAWTAFLNTLLIVSGLAATVVFVVMTTVVPPPMIGNAGLGEFDERLEFPRLPSYGELGGEAASLQLKPLVVVISPFVSYWFGREVRSSGFGAGALLVADSKGFLFATAQHVVSASGKLGARIAVAGLSGEWGSAEVAGIHRQRDVALVWMPRQSGNSEFVQPLSSPKDGESIFIIGHPEGFRFSSSSGNISRVQPGLLQISAAVSPGNSGGPVYDLRGNLLGIVTSAMDKTARPNAENLNFAVPSDLFLDASAWVLSQHGSEYLQKVNRLRP